MSDHSPHRPEHQHSANCQHGPASPMDPRGHGHSHVHSDSDGHGHHHGPTNYNRAFAIGIALNIGFVIVETIYGLLANSMALVADAGHNLSDVIGLVVAWIAFWLATKKPSTYFTYGMRRSSILSALFNAVLLLVALGAILLESIQRFWHPDPIQSTTMIVVASIGIVINAVTALMFMKDSAHDINIRGAYLHMAADAVISLGVVIAGVVIYYTGWIWLDPVISILICFVIFGGTWSLLRSSVRLSMDAVPSSVDPLKVRSYLESLPGVTEVHDLHIWGLSTTENALTVHLIIPGLAKSDPLLARISKDLKADFNIHHPTVQIETGEASFACELQSNDVV